MRLRVGVAAGAKGRDEDRSLGDLAGLRVDDVRGLPSVVDEQLLAGTVVLAHYHIEGLAPLPIARAELGVLVPVGVLRLVLLPQQHERDALALELAEHRGEVRFWAVLLPQRRWVECGFQSGVVEVVRQRPGQAGHLGAKLAVRHRRGRNPETAGHLTTRSL